MKRNLERGEESIGDMMPITNPLTITDIATLFYNLFVSYSLGSVFLAGLFYLFVLAYIGKKFNWSGDTYIVVFTPYLVWLGFTMLPMELRAIVGLGGAVILAYALWKFFGK